MTYKMKEVDGNKTRMVALYESHEELLSLFNEDFMKTYTNFDSFEEFIFSSAVFVDWKKEFIVEDKTAFDCCVVGKTQFKTWQAMYDKAYEEKRKK